MFSSERVVAGGMLSGLGRSSSEEEELRAREVPLILVSHTVSTIIIMFVSGVLLLPIRAVIKVVYVQTFGM
jgi:hypothetical protein